MNAQVTYKSFGDAASMARLVSLDLWNLFVPFAECVAIFSCDYLLAGRATKEIGGRFRHFGVRPTRRKAFGLVIQGPTFAIRIGGAEDLEFLLREFVSYHTPAFWLTGGSGVLSQDELTGLALQGPNRGLSAVDAMGAAEKHDWELMVVGIDHDPWYMGGFSMWSPTISTDEFLAELSSIQRLPGFDVVIAPWGHDPDD